MEEWEFFSSSFSLCFFRRSGVWAVFSIITGKREVKNKTLLAPVIRWIVVLMSFSPGLDGRLVRGSKEAGRYHTL